MKNSNIIISVIIVLCIAAGVTAYGLTNQDNGILTSLPGFSTDSSPNSEDVSEVDNGGENDGSASAAESGSSSGSSSGGTGSGNSHNGMTSNKALEIATGAIQEPGAYPGTPTWDSSMNMWIIKIYDSDGNVIGGIGVDPSTGRTNKV
ncbi:hypothetical protein MBCUT_15290 [Methanobrevibacter cuticularis]|uniref:PepSY domain-containing protein n=1 Tax=Methanobrevibacter cuticularis TaxID=47311 RepID=A0A166DCE3_9EURY|nr:hypothetical protein [Methanobrevibacter cuticularis]KZX15441.1 hypothetical protein MBCUT_15290 [Methanobrevibacter cuticularis]